MKKFYISIFAAGLLLTSLLSEGQVFNSITSNPNHYTFDDPRFWGQPLPGPSLLQPGNPCNGCTINVFSSVLVAADGQSTAGFTGIGFPVLNGGSINVYGTATLTVNSYLTLNNANITIGNDPVSVDTIYANNQISLNGTSSIILANQFTVINTNNDNGNTVTGPYTVSGVPLAGIYTLRSSGPGAGQADATLTQLGYFNYNVTYGFGNYTINCDVGVPVNPLNSCSSGLVFGPAATQYDAANDIYDFVASTTLPVVLVKLAATKNDDGSVNVVWATSQEQNSDYFDIERSSDQSGWSKIGSVKAKGYSSTPTNYTYLDKLPLDGVGYYRLKMVDLDGKTVYSKDVQVSTGKNNQPLVIYNNPFTDQIRLKVNVARSQNLVMTVTDMVGKTYIRQNYSAQLGDNFVNMPAPIGGSGMYILHIHGDSYEQAVKIEKQ